MSTQTPATAVIEENLHGLEQLRTHFGEVLAGEELGIFEARVREMQDLTEKPDLAERLITLRFLDQLLEILRVARETLTDPLRAARAYYLTSELLDVPWLRQALTQAGRSGWNQRMSQGLLDDLARAHRTVTRAVVRAGEPAEPIEELFERVRERAAAELTDFHALLDEIRADSGELGLAALAVAVRELVALSGSRPSPLQFRSFWSGDHGPAARPLAGPRDRLADIAGAYIRKGDRARAGKTFVLDA